jgi:hypothetical protein
MNLSGAVTRLRGVRADPNRLYSDSPTASRASSTFAYIFPERPRLSEAHLDRNPCGLRTPALVDDDDDALPGVQVILGLQLPVIPRIRPLGHELVRALGAGVDLLVRPAEAGHIPDEIASARTSPVAMKCP